MVETPCRATGVRGIYNMGATCYMNVILQPLAHNPMIRNWYLSDGHQSSECQKKHCVGCSMDDMFQDFYAQESTTGYSASNILACVLLSPRKAYVELSSNKEQDAHEFFQFITEELHEISCSQNAQAQDESSPKRLKSGNDGACKCIIHQTFYGKMQSTITCQSCKAINTSADLFLDISLGLDVISKKKNAKALCLKQCLDVEYKLPEDCDYACRQCTSQRATKQLSIKSLPNVLCIQLKVFSLSVSCADYDLVTNKWLRDSSKTLALHRKSRLRSRSHSSLICFRTRQELGERTSTVQTCLEDARMIYRVLLFMLATSKLAITYVILE